jgi:hypothetical protein
MLILESWRPTLELWRLLQKQWAHHLVMSTHRYSRMLTLGIRVLNQNLFVIILQKAMEAHNGGLETHSGLVEAYSGVV